MKRALSFFLLTTMMFAGVAFAADPIVGTWKLNVEKSKFSAGSELTAATRTYTESNGLYTMEQKQTGADGKENSYKVHYREGKEEKSGMSGSDNSTVLATKVNDHTWNFALKEDGKVVGHTHRVMSADGKTLTVHNSGMHVGGAKGDQTLVFEKQ